MSKPDLFYQRTGEIGCKKHGFSMIRGTIPHERCVACDLDAELKVGVAAFELASATIADLEARLAERDTKVVELEQNLQKEIAIVDRVWSALGCTVFEDAKGKTIWDLVRENRARLAASEKEVERLTEETKHLWDYNNQRQAKIEALEQRVIELTAEVQARNSAVDAQAVQLGKLRAGLAECEGLLRRVDHNLLYSGTASLRAEIDAYFERRKP